MIEDPKHKIDDVVFYCTYDTGWKNHNIHKATITDLSKDFGQYSDWKYRIIFYKNIDGEEIKETRDVEERELYKDISAVLKFIDEKSMRCVENLKKEYEKNVEKERLFRFNFINDLKTKYPKEYQRENRNNKLNRILDGD